MTFILSTCPMGELNGFMSVKYVQQIIVIFYIRSTNVFLDLCQCQTCFYFFCSNFVFCCGHPAMDLVCCIKSNNLPSVTTLLNGLFLF